MKTTISEAFKKVMAERDARNLGRTKVLAKDLSSVVYLFENAYGQPCAVGYKGRALKPSINYRYSSPEARANRVAEWMQSVSKSSEVRRKREARSLQVGDVLRSMWGYDQTNVDFYKVTAIFGEYGVEIVEIGAESEENAHLEGEVIPDKTRVIGEPMRKQAQGNSVKISSFQTATKLEPVKIAGCEVYKSSRYSSYH